MTRVVENNHLIENNLANLLAWWLVILIAKPEVERSIPTQDISSIYIRQFFLCLGVIFLYLICMRLEIYKYVN